MQLLVAFFCVCVNSSTDFIQKYLLFFKAEKVEAVVLRMRSDIGTNRLLEPGFLIKSL